MPGCLANTNVKFSDSSCMVCDNSHNYMAVSFGYPENSTGSDMNFIMKEVVCITNRHEHPHHQSGNKLHSLDQN